MLATPERITTTVFDAHVQKQEIRIVDKYFGRLGRDLIFHMHRPNGFQWTPDAEKGINHHFFSTIREEFGLSPGQDLEFYRNQLNRANKIIKYLVENLGLPEEMASLRNEVSLYSDSPAYRLRRIADINGVDFTLRYEIARQMFLALAIAPLDARAIGDRFESRLTEFQDFLDDNLYSGKVGETKKREVYSEHDNQTNGLVQFKLDTPFMRSYDHHLKKHTFKVRKTVLGSEVLTQARHKGETESLIKSLEKALHNGGVIDILSAVKDSIGMQIVVMGEGTERDQFVEQFDGLVRTFDQFESAEEDPISKTDRGQNTNAVKSRRKYCLKGLSVPVEVMFFSLPEYLDQVYEVGDGINGKAHKLYELRRLGHAVHHLFPRDVYGADFDIDSMIREKMALISNELKLKNSWSQ